MTDNQTLKDILENVQFIKDNAVTKEEFDKRLDKIDKRMDKFESQMVTKEYLDDKLSDKKGDAIQVVKQEDDKLNVLVGTLHDKKVLTDNEKKKILSLKPYPQLAA